ncbi:MAG: tyrosine-type recombinase/integrase [Acidaminococcales bacterium]|nr:tyrosine-type recombinase/integrase [Acidaminococcales bacterium]
MALTEPIRNSNDVKKLVGYYLEKEEPRNYALIVLGIYTALRISDILNLRWRDVYDFNTEKFYECITLVEKKTGKDKCLALNSDALQVLKYYQKKANNSWDKEGFLFVSKTDGRAISRIQAYRIVKKAAAAIGLPNNISCHSLRKTFGYHAWKKHVPVAVIMDIYNHTSLSVTRRYLGVCQDDRNDVYKSMSFFD